VSAALETAVPGLRLRLAAEADVALILELIQALAEYEKLAHEVVATEELLGESLFGGGKGGPEVVIAEFEGEAAGFALFFANYSTFLGRAGMHLEDLYVREALRGKGIGKALLSCLAKLAVERRCGRLEWNVLDWNEPAIRFYESLGAAPMSGWTTYRVTGDALARLADVK
jgi:GNAT superfamily N-acetyltransferase